MEKGCVQVIFLIIIICIASSYECISSNIPTLEEIKSYEDKSEAGTMVYSISFDENEIGQERIFKKDDLPVPLLPTMPIFS